MTYWLINQSQTNNKCLWHSIFARWLLHIKRFIVDKYRMKTASVRDWTTSSFVTSIFDYKEITRRLKIHQSGTSPSDVDTGHDVSVIEHVPVTHRHKDVDVRNVSWRRRSAVNGDVWYMNTGDISWAVCRRVLLSVSVSVLLCVYNWFVCPRLPVFICLSAYLTAILPLHFYQ